MIHTSSRYPLFLSVCAVVALLLAFFLTVPSRALAADIFVNSLEDNVRADDNCTLREAINNANADFRQTTSGECAVGEGQGGSQDRIAFAVGVVGRITLDRTLPAIVSAHGLEIDGGTACTIFGAEGPRVCRDRITISGNNTVRVFVVDSRDPAPAQLTLRNLNIIGGNNEGDGGGILNRGILTIVDSTLSDNRARNGGGIFNDVSPRGGLVTIINSTFSRNHGNPGAGGAIETRFSDFTSEPSALVLRITNSTFSDNDAIGAGGAIAISLGTPSQTCVMNITNSTFSHNRSSFGGAIASSCTLVDITFSTFFDNSSVVFIPLFGGFEVPVAGIATSGRPETTLRNTLLESPLEATHFACSALGTGRIIDGGFNIEDGTTCGFSETNNSMPNTRALLDPLGLQSNGGPTETIALCTEAGAPSAPCPGRSPAIDKIPFGINECLLAIDTDQRGFRRPQGENMACDVGAFEFLITRGCTVNDVPGQLCQGTSGADRIIGTTGKDVIYGLAGDDDVDGGDEDDILFGGQDDDRLIGGNADDQLFGQTNDDDLRGDAGNDLLEGGPGADMLDGGDDTDDCNSDAEDPSVVFCE